MYSRLLVALAALVLAPSQVNAKWYEAKSRHFIVYSEQSPEELRNYASKLERYDSAIRAVRKMPDPQANTSDRLTVYLVKEARTVAELAGAPEAAYSVSGRAPRQVRLLSPTASRKGAKPISTGNPSSFTNICTT